MAAMIDYPSSSIIIIIIIVIIIIAIITIFSIPNRIRLDIIKFERFCRTFQNSFNGFYQNFSILNNSYLSVFSEFLLKENTFSSLRSYPSEERPHF